MLLTEADEWAEKAELDQKSDYRLKFNDTIDLESNITFDAHDDSKVATAYLPPGMMFAGNASEIIAAQAEVFEAQDYLDDMVLQNVSLDGASAKLKRAQKKLAALYNVTVRPPEEKLTRLLLHAQNNK